MLLASRINRLEIEIFDRISRNELHDSHRYGSSMLQSQSHFLPCLAARQRRQKTTFRLHTSRLRMCLFNRPLEWMSNEFKIIYLRNFLSIQDL